MVIRLLLIALAAYIGTKLVFRMIRYITAGTDRGAQLSPNEEAPTSELYRDPVCGIYVPADEAISVRNEGRIVYFCSEVCRDRFINRVRQS